MMKTSWDKKKKEVMETFSYHALLTQIVEQVAFLALSRILGKSFLQKSLAFGILDHIFLWLKNQVKFGDGVREKQQLE